MLSDVSHLTQPDVALIKIGHHLLKTRKGDTLDIVFVVDASKSMRNDIDAVRNHLNQMTDLLKSAELDFTVDWWRSEMAPVSPCWVGIFK